MEMSDQCLNDLISFLFYSFFAKQKRHTYDKYALKLNWGGRSLQKINPSIHETSNNESKESIATQVSLYG